MFIVTHNKLLRYIVATRIIEEESSDSYEILADETTSLGYRGVHSCHMC